MEHYCASPRNRTDSTLADSDRPYAHIYRATWLCRSNANQMRNQDVHKMFIRWKENENRSCKEQNPVLILEDRYHLIFGN